MKEFELISSLERILDQKFDSGMRGPGDDAACVDLSTVCSKQLLLSSDMLVEGVHFRFDWSSMKDIAWKALAVNESDIAAMGGVPLGFLVSLGVPESGDDIVLQLYEGFKEYLESRKLKIFGGDIVRAGTLSISVSVFGFSDAPILRCGAQVGDTVYLSREVGWAGMGLRVLKGDCVLPESLKLKALEAHRRPVPETELARELSLQGIATSMIDVSDGFLQDARHICQASNVNFLLSEKALAICDFEGLSGKDRLEGLTSGDDYALIVTSGVPPEKMSSHGLPSRMIAVGEVVPPEGDQLIRIVPSNSPTQNPQTLSGFLERNGLDSKKLGYSH